MESVQTQQERDRQTRLDDVDNRNGRDVLEKRQRRETEGAVFETRGTAGPYLAGGQGGQLPPQKS